MGLNLDVGHIAFASRRKFDGRQRRYLRADELAQIAGRAGRFRDDGTFGETADCTPFEEETVERIVNHHFEPVDYINWRNSDLDWSSVANLLASLRRSSPDVILRRAPEALDETTLATLAQDEDVVRNARTHAHVRRLWDLCTLPDFRKHGADAHFKLVQSFVEKLAEPSARIKDEWMYAHVEPLDRTEGEIDTLQQRLAAIRTWTYAANRTDWLENAETWRGRTREIEDKLSDALHQALMLRFVDRRTSALLKTLNSEEDAPAEIGPAGEVLIGGHNVGRLEGLVFTAEATGETLAGRALRGAALKALRERTFFWFDIFSNSQHNVADKPFEWWTQVFQSNVQRIGHTLLVLEWENPIPHAVWSQEEVMAVKPTHVERTVFGDGDADVAVLMRGDQDVNEVKLKNHLGATVVELARWL